MVVGLEKPEMPSVSMTRPFRALLGSSWMASVPALTIPSRLVSPGSWDGANKVNVMSMDSYGGYFFSLVLARVL